MHATHTHTHTHYHRTETQKITQKRVFLDSFSELDAELCTSAPRQWRDAGICWRLRGIVGKCTCEEYSLQSPGLIWDLCSLTRAIHFSFAQRNLLVFPFLVCAYLIINSNTKPDVSWSIIIITIIIINGKKINASTFSERTANIITKDMYPIGKHHNEFITL